MLAFAPWFDLLRRFVAFTLAAMVTPFGSWPAEVAAGREQRFVYELNCADYIPR
jgi:hypothetical protein